MDRRSLLVGAAAVCVAGALPDPGDAEAFAVLDAVGPLLGDDFHPGRALAAATLLVARPPAERVALLRRYLAVRPDPPEGLFAVVRTLVEVPPPTHPATEFPGVSQPGWLRPPALGGPGPAPPADLRQHPRWPVLVVADVPLVVVRSYVLGGVPEPLAMHLDGLAGATWRTAPLRPGTDAQVEAALAALPPVGDSETPAVLRAQLARRGT